jgi:hypothetical protein
VPITKLATSLTGGVKVGQMTTFQLGLPSGSGACHPSDLSLSSSCDVHLSSPARKALDTTSASNDPSSDARNCAKCLGFLVPGEDYYPTTWRCREFAKEVIPGAAIEGWGYGARSVLFQERRRVCQPVFKSSTRGCERMSRAAWNLVTVPAV